MLDGGAPYYRTYKCKDGLFIAVGSIEPKFYKSLLNGMGFKEPRLSELISDHLNFEEWGKMHNEFENIFL